MNKLLMSRKCFKSCIENVLVKLLFIIAQQFNGPALRGDCSNRN